MTTFDPSLLDSILDETINNPEANNPLDYLEEDNTNIPIVQLPAGEIDPRLKLLSHSSRNLLHSCPRKYQLYRLSATEAAPDETKAAESEVTFSYGHTVGIGVAAALEDKTEDQIYIEAFLGWDADLLANTPRQKKSFWLAMFAVQKFIALRSSGYLADYELVYFEGKPAVELSFQILLPNGFKYRGFVDAVLRHKVTGEIVVLECKTSSGTANPAMYKNSGQALGYAVILDKIAPSHSSYTVLYLVYETKSYEYKELPFEKTLLQRALWLQELLIDTEVISLYDSYDVYPTDGQSCYNFFRECEYLGLCNLSTEKLTKPLTENILADIEKDSDNYQFTINFDELINSQLEKGG